MRRQVVIFTLLFKLSLCRDFILGMHRKNDTIVARDIVYKEKNYFGFATAHYGRVFKCPITYFKVSDRLGVNSSPIVTVTRGGLGKKYITVLLTSSYDAPIAVNIHVSCAKKVALGCSKSLCPKETKTSINRDENSQSSPKTSEDEKKEDEERPANGRDSLGDNDQYSEGDYDQSGENPDDEYDENPDDQAEENPDDQADENPDDQADENPDDQGDEDNEAENEEASPNNDEENEED